MPEGFQKGLVAYFDILGFTAIAASTDIVGAAEFVERELLSIPSKIQDEVKRKRGPLDRSDTHSVIFADSILIWYSVPEREFCEGLHWHYFFSICSRFMQRMFENGLPLRGAISAGEFFIKDHCFVGKPITDCHELAARTEWAGCTIVRGAQEELEKTNPDWETILEQDCVPYRVPFKEDQLANAKTTPSLVLKWHHFGAWHPNGPMPDIRENVHRSFKAHEKAFPENAALKARNTIAFLEFVSTLYVNSNAKKCER